MSQAGTGTHTSIDRGCFTGYAHSGMHYLCPGTRDLGAHLRLPSLPSRWVQSEPLSSNLCLLLVSSVRTILKNKLNSSTLTCILSSSLSQASSTHRLHQTPTMLNAALFSHMHHCAQCRIPIHWCASFTLRPRSAPLASRTVLESCAR